MNDKAAGTKALVFDVFGTVVDWHGSVAREVRALAKEKGFRVNAVKFARAWRAGYRPAMDKVLRGEVQDVLPPLDVTPPRDVNRIDCAEAGTTYIYLISDKYELYSFDPATLATPTKIGNIACPSDDPNATPFSMAVDRQGIAYILFTDERIIPLPAYPVVQVCDPTGAGDSFAGALMGHLQRRGSVDERSFREAMAYGTVVASYTVEEFGVGRIGDVTERDLNERYRQYRELISL